MNWNLLYNNIASIDNLVALNEIPHQFLNDASECTVAECLKWINEENQTPIKPGLIPIYGNLDRYAYEESCSFLLIEPSTGKFYEISGSHCSCYGFENQFVPEECPIEYLAKGKKWSQARETVLSVVAYFRDKIN